MDLNISQITTSFRATNASAASDVEPLTDDQLDRLAELLAARQEHLRASAAARSLAPDDPAGDLDRWD